MSDMSGKTVLVTGATSGIGLETARQLGLAGARVLVHGRNAEKAQSAASALWDAGVTTVTPLAADLSVQQQVRDLNAAVRQATGRLDVLVNNAGVFMPERVLTPDGVETTLAVNHLAGFLLTLSLGDLLADSSPARVVMVSSIAHHNGVIDFDDMNGESGYDGLAAYQATKLMNVLFAVELSKRWSGTGITANAVHPGVIDTKLLHTGYPGQGGASVEVGAVTPVYVASSPDLEETSGRFFVNQRAGYISPLASDKDLRGRLWKVSEQMIGMSG